MSKELLQFPCVDLDSPDPRTSNRRTPSQKRHINSLPPELLIVIFQNYCGLEYGPVSLSLVCHFWEAVVTACPALWSSIIFERTIYPENLSERSDPIKCRDWSSLERAVTRAGDATLSVVFHLSTTLYPYDEEERVLQLFSRCRFLHITLEVAGYSFASSITMPHLEHLVLNIDEHAQIEPLLDSVQKGSPLLRSLSISGFVPANLASHKSLLRRIVHLDLLFIGNNNITFQGLQNLEELKLDSLYNKAAKFSPSCFPKLVSLYIRDTSLPIKQQLMTFPVLESLTWFRTWSILQFIAAPKLKTLILLHQDPRTSGEQPMSTLRQTTVRPTILSTDFLSDDYLPELLSLWSNLSELHLRDKGETCIPGPITTAALAGGGDAAPLCPSLRCLTVHMEQGRKNLKSANMSIQRLTGIVRERKAHGIIDLQRLMCIWDWKDRMMGSTEVEWVDVL